MNRTSRIGLLTLALCVAGSLRADDKAPAANDAAAENKQLSDELASSWKENAELKAQLATAQAAASKSDASAADLQKQLDAAKATPPAPAPSDSDLSKQLADAQDKLTVSLRSFSVIQDENTQLHASVDKLNGDNAMLSAQLEQARASITTLQAQAALTSQIEPLRTQLRQAQDETSHLAAENEQLRTKVALESPAPAAGKPVPLRPERVAPAVVPTPVPTPAAPEVRTYTVVEGDTLTKIARKFYGNANKWSDILKANHDVLKDEKSLVVGSTIKIP